MTTVDFHAGLGDKLAYACRLVRKAWRSGHRVVVTGESADLARLDQLLWTFEPGEFIPHLRLRPGSALAVRMARTPVWLADRPADAPPREVLVNLGPAMVSESPAFARVFELVGRDEDDAAAGRQRWRQHRAAGLEPRLHSVDGAA